MDSPAAHAGGRDAQADRRRCPAVAGVTLRSLGCSGKVAYPGRGAGVGGDSPGSGAERRYLVVGGPDECAAGRASGCLAQSARAFGRAGYTAAEAADRIAAVADSAGWVAGR